MGITFKKGEKVKVIGKQHPLLKVGEVITLGEEDTYSSVFKSFYVLELKGELTDYIYIDDIEKISKQLELNFY
jgi:hypothetical protein